MNSKERKKPWQEWAWDSWCCLSIIGIWPRFIEPQWVEITRSTQKVPHWPKGMHNLRLLQCSDIHLSNRISPRFLQKIHKKIACSNPDIVVFTGDFLCGSQMVDEALILEWLQGIQAPLGCYAILGNHDYDHYLCLNKEGHYDIGENKKVSINTGFCNLVRRIFRGKESLSGMATSTARQVIPHPQLVHALEKTHWKILHNQTLQIPVRDTYFNLVGLGEHMGGQCDPKKAFSQFHSDYPGLVLVHNPDAFPTLQSFPGEYIFSGHCHGGQVNIPWIGNRITLMENPQWRRGWIHEKGKKMYINRGLHSVVPFRWFSRPELSLIDFKVF